MGEPVWTLQFPPGPAFVPGPFGETTGERKVHLSVVTGFGLFQIMARRGQWQATAREAESIFGLRPPERPAAHFAPGVTLIWSGPDQFLSLISPPRPMHEIQAAFRGMASVSDQSHGRVLFRIGGPKAVDTLAKVSSVDLDSSVFSAGSAAMTSIDHTGVTLWRELANEVAPVFAMLVFTSFAETLWGLLVDSAAEFGGGSSAATML